MIDQEDHGPGDETMEAEEEKGVNGDEAQAFKTFVDLKDKVFQSLPVTESKNSRFHEVRRILVGSVSQYLPLGIPFIPKVQIMHYLVRIKTSRNGKIYASMDGICY